MTAVLTTYPDVEQRTDAWDDLRRGLLTASAIGQLLTSTLRVADNDTSRALVATLVAERITGHTEEGVVTSDMWRGIEHEPYALEAYVARTGNSIEPCGFMLATADHWTIGYSPDALVGDDGLVEVKCPRAKGHLQTVTTDQVPARYVAQLQAGLLVSGRAWIDFVSFFGGLPLYIKRVTPDPDWQAALIAAATAFEENAHTLANTYSLAVAGLPNTDRVPDPEEIRF